jgi:hypothetical protein
LFPLVCFFYETELFHVKFIGLLLYYYEKKIV